MFGLHAMLAMRHLSSQLFDYTCPLLAASSISMTGYNRLKIPRRPPWSEEQSPEEIDTQERAAFLGWRRALAAVEESERLVLTPFEKNLEVWRQLWRVVERSHIVVQVDSLVLPSIIIEVLSAASMGIRILPCCVDVDCGARRRHAIQSPEYCTQQQLADTCRLSNWS